MYPPFVNPAYGPGCNYSFSRIFSTQVLYSYFQNLKVTGPFIAPSSGGGGNSGAGSSAADIAGVPGIVIIIV